MEGKPIKIPSYVTTIVNQLELSGYDAYLVGGAVRDLLMHREPNDYDITTNALPEQVKSIFPHVVFTGGKHGTVTVVTDDGNVEVTTMRRDGIYKDNRRPETVQFTDNIYEDLARRDFTINAMAISKDDWIGQDGITDLGKGIIKTVGNPDKRFNEDALRMMRAIRFACQLDFGIEDNTFKSICENRLLINNISNERIRDELSKILVSDYPGRGIELLRLSGILEVILPEIRAMVGFNQHNPHHHMDVYLHTLNVMEGVSNDLLLRLSALLHDVGKPATFTLDDDGVGHFYKHHVVGANMAKDILERLRFDNNSIDTVCALVKEHMVKHDNVKPKRLINRIGAGNINRLFELLIADTKASLTREISGIVELKEEIYKILEEKQPLTVKDLQIDGYDLMVIGMKPGKQMGKVLNELLDLVLDDPKKNTWEYLMKYTKENLWS